MNPFFSAQGKILIFAHRGALKGMTSNTLEGIRRSLSTGIDGIELDVQATKDKKLVIFHDEDILIQDKKQKIRSLTFNEVCSVDLGGAQIPSIEDVFSELQKTSAFLILDVKSRGIISEILTQAKQYGFHNRIIISSFDYTSLRQAYHLAPKVLRGIILGFSRVSWHISGLAWTIFSILFPVQAARWVKAQVILCFSFRLTNNLIKKARKNGISIFLWTKSKLENGSPWKTFPIDGIITCEPVEVAQSLKNPAQKDHIP